MAVGALSCFGMRVYFGGVFSVSDDIVEVFGDVGV